MPLSLTGTNELNGHSTASEMFYTNGFCVNCTMHLIHKQSPNEIPILDLDIACTCFEKLQSFPHLYT